MFEMSSAARKQMIFDGVKALREMDGGKSPYAKKGREGSAIAQSMMIRTSICRHISTR